MDERRLERRPESRRRRATFAIPTEDPRRAGLTNTGRPSARELGEHALALARQRRSATPRVRDLRHAGGAHQRLEADLVHAQRRGGDAAADVGDVEAFEQPLDDAVLAERPVQRRERDVGAEQAAGRRAATARGRRAASARRAPARPRRPRGPPAARPSATDAADASETSCSDERPPPRTATRIRSRRWPPHGRRRAAGPSLGARSAR